jgi:hypothetical protein
MIYFDYERLANDLLDHMVEATSPNETIEFLFMCGWDSLEIIKLRFDKDSVDRIYKKLKLQSKILNIQEDK